ncbi:MAG: DUF2164 domain-containing protein [Marinobacterium sp.]|nr:DUF2164 domain-containing protein [Marinobacterium sp.]
MVKFSREEKEQLVRDLRAYCETELETELGGFQAEFLLDFICEKLAPHTYNQALKDVEALIRDRTERLAEEVEALAK